MHTVPQPATLTEVTVRIPSKSCQCGALWALTIGAVGARRSRLAQESGNCLPSSCRQETALETVRSAPGCALITAATRGTTHCEHWGWGWGGVWMGLAVGVEVGVEVGVGVGRFGGGSHDESSRANANPDSMYHWLRCASVVVDMGKGRAAHPPSWQPPGVVPLPACAAAAWHAPPPSLPCPVTRGSAGAKAPPAPQGPQPTTERMRAHQLELQ